MTRIRSRWHDAGVLGVSPGTPGKQAAAAFALYGLRLQAQGISPGPIEATITITDRHGHLVGQLDLDARDAQWMVEAVSGMLNLVYGPWRAEDVDRLLADYGPARQARDHRHNPDDSAWSPGTETSVGRGRLAVGGRSAAVMEVESPVTGRRDSHGPHGTALGRPSQGVLEPRAYT